AFTHHLETTFEQVRKGEVPATRELIAVVLEAQDHMRNLVNSPYNTQPEIGEKLLSKLHDAIGGKVATASSGSTPSKKSKSSKPSASSEKTWEISFSLPANAMAN